MFVCAKKGCVGWVESGVLGFFCVLGGASGFFWGHNLLLFGASVKGFGGFWRVR